MQQRQQKPQQDDDTKWTSYLRFIDGASESQTREWVKVRKYPLVLESALQNCLLGLELKHKKDYSPVPVQMAAADMGIRVLRSNDNIKAYIHQVKEIRSKGAAKATAYLNFEDRKEEYSFVSRGNDNHKKLCVSETVNNRVGELSNEIKMYHATLIPVCQIYGYNEILRNLSLPTELIQVMLKEEIDEFELFLDKRLILLWYTFRKPNIDYEKRVITF